MKKVIHTLILLTSLTSIASFADEKNIKIEIQADIIDQNGHTYREQENVKICSSLTYLVQNEKTRALKSVDSSIRCLKTVIYNGKVDVLFNTKIKTGIFSDYNKIIQNSINLKSVTLVKYNSINNFDRNQMILSKSQITKDRTTNEILVQGEIERAKN